jgi:N-acetylglucosamine-6-phosphate deacetylase
MTQILRPDAVFDGHAIRKNVMVEVEGGFISRIMNSGEATNGPVTTLSGLLAPGLVDLQVNGGGGVMLDRQTTPDMLNQMLEAHARLGATTILPTLITDTAAATRTVIALAKGCHGLAGLHLEGPHLDPRRAGAHDPTLIRAMTDDDMTMYLQAAKALPLLKITLAPASVTVEKVRRLTDAGVLVSLGHADCSFEEAAAYVSSGARIVTHLFNAMSQLGSREPGLVGAALDLPVHAGLIADGVHSHPATAMAALRASDRIFLVSDAMAVSGSNLKEFYLQGRKILRQNGRLTLADGTLAGADLTLPQAIANVIGWGISPERALAMATTIPANLINRPDLGRIQTNARADLTLFDSNWQLKSVWKNGKII